MRCVGFNATTRGNIFPPDANNNRKYKKREFAPPFPNKKASSVQPLTPWQASQNPGRTRRQRRSSPGGRSRRPLRVFAAGTPPVPVHVAPLPFLSPFQRRDSRRLRVETLPLLVLLHRLAVVVRRRERVVDCTGRK